VSREADIKPDQEIGSHPELGACYVLMSLLSAMVLPAVVTAATIGLGRALAARESSTRGDSLWAGPAIGLAYIAGQSAIVKPSFPPVDVTDRIPWLALIAMSLEVAEIAWPLAARLRFLGRALLLTLILGLMLGPVISAGDLPWTTIGWLSAAAVTAVLAWLNLWALGGTLQGTDAYRGLMLTSGGAVVVLLLSGSAVLCLLGMVLTVTLVAARITAWHRAPVSGLIVGGALLTALVIECYVYASIPFLSAVLLAAAPAGAWIARWKPLRDKVGITATVLSTLAVLVPLGLAVGLAAASSPYE
jgi:hypothetical protein